MDKKQKIFIAGHRGLVGSALLRKLQSEGYKHLLTRTRSQLDLTNQDQVERFFASERPEYVLLAAAKVGGILANCTYPVSFIRDNLLIQTNIIDAAFRYGTKKLLFLGSSCIYPKFAPQPIKEAYLLTSSLEPTNEAYAIAKIAGIRMCQAYYQQHCFDSICVMPTNLYGEGDNFDLLNSHVLPALMTKFHEARTSGAREVTVWGTGTPRREFLHVDDLADACHFLMQQPSEKIEAIAPDRIFNVGTGEDIEIRDLALLLRDMICSGCELNFDMSKPDGTPRKLLDVNRLAQLGWTAKIPLREGLQRTYRWFCGSTPQQREKDASSPLNSLRN